MPINLSAAIYGTLTVGALLDAESAHQETYAGTLVAVLLALLMYLFAHAYSEFASRRLQESEPFTIAGLGHAVRSSTWIMLGAVLPAVALLAEWAAGVELSTGISLAILSSAATVVLLEVAGAVRAKQSGRDLVVQIVAGALLGLGIILLRLVLH